VNLFTLFSGGGGGDIGAKNAGITSIGGIEYDAKIANVARQNGVEVTTADILECDPASFPKPDILHASPPCPNFSVAKVGAKETDNDLALARKVAEFIEVWRPKYFTLENVYLYRKSQSWAIIRDTLYKLGYSFSLDHVNFANFGVPQTRKRMMIRAVNGLGCFMPPPMPAPVKWVGWYEAVEDLIPTFKDDTFTDWQWKKIPDKYKTFLFNAKDSGSERGKGYRDIHEPAFTIQTSPNLLKAFLFEGRAGGNRDLQVKEKHEPSMTVANGDMPAFTTTASVAKRQTRGFMNGRIVRLPPPRISPVSNFA
jgi:DNA (cytosine-5)-methyltransferase 1